MKVLIPMIELFEKVVKVHDIVLLLKCLLVLWIIQSYTSEIPKNLSLFDLKLSPNSIISFVNSTFYKKKAI